MHRIKTLSLPLISALFAAAVVPAGAQVSLTLSSEITYRQYQKKLAFTGGLFDVSLNDGQAIYVGGCESSTYNPPGTGGGGCSPGTTGLISGGSIEGIQEGFPYLVVTSVIPAFAIAPHNADKVFLNAAPASTLPRPSGGFRDESFSLFFNLTTTQIREYLITQYFQKTKYTSKQQDKFISQIVPGAYYYSFPRFGAPEQSSAISATIYPMLEGRREINHTEQGFAFTKVNKSKWNKRGFVELSYIKPNVINWIGVNPTNVFAAVDKMYFSIKVIQNPNNPKSSIVENYAGEPISIFPPYQNGSDPRVQIPNPYKGNFTTPPIFDGGTTGVIQIELDRNLQSGGVSYDFSKRTFQIPVRVVNRYTEYEELVFNKNNKSTDILEDTDKDGYNNLNEWILDSNAKSAGSIPEAPRPDLIEEVDTILGLPTGNTFFGFDVPKKLGTVPAVAYTLQRSRDQGKTWKTFKSDRNWSVRTVRSAPISNQPRKITIQVRSLARANGEPVQPPGTINDIYRVKITLRKKK